MPGLKRPQIIQEWKHSKYLIHNRRKKNWIIQEIIVHHLFLSIYNRSRFRVFALRIHFSVWESEGFKYEFSDKEILVNFYVYVVHPMNIVLQNNHSLPLNENYIPNIRKINVFWKIFQVENFDLNPSDSQAQKYICLVWYYFEETFH